MIDLRFVERREWISDERSVGHRILQWRCVENPLEVGLQEPIWSDWQDVRVEKERD